VEAKAQRSLGVRLSEGPALRVRVVRRDASPGYGMITEERTNGRWPNREMLRSSASLSRGRAEPAPPGMDSIARPNACRGVSLHDLGRPVARGPMPTCLGQTHPFLPGVRSPPLRGVDHPRGDGLAGKSPGIALMAFSRRDALCASALQGLTHAEAFHYTTWVDRWPVARCRHASAKPTHSFRACGARPSAG
jgi:hypothetical protein